MVKEPFESKKEFCFAPEEYLLPNMAAHPSSSGDPVIAKRDELVVRIKEDAERVRTLIPQIGIAGNTAKAFIMDFDLSARWKGYFNVDHSSGSISVGHFVQLKLFFAADNAFGQGTYLFMSDASRSALDSGARYLQSPVDDIESFSWALLYGIV